MLGDNAGRLGNVCIVCGRPLKPFGNKILKDGILCRKCIKLISPWLSDEEVAGMTVEDIKVHMKKREENKNVLNTFAISRCVDEKYELCVDDAKKLFYFNKNNDNPDVLPLEDFESIQVYEKKDPDNEENCDVWMKVEMKGKDFASIDFRLNEFPGIAKGSEEEQKAFELGMRYMNVLDHEEETQ